MARVLMVASEAAPFAKTGGLADVLGALPVALREGGDDVAVVLPRYGSIDLRSLRRVYDRIPVHLGLARFDTSIYEANAAYPLYLVDCPPLYDRKGLYGGPGNLDFPDNHIRFAVLARAALGVARSLFRTEIFHCHDWQAGLVPALLRSDFATDPTFLGTKTVFTIHNLGYQGLFPQTAVAEAGIDPSLFRPDGLEFFGDVSYIKGGIAFADALTTVSPTYAKEIQTPKYGFGLDGALRARADVLTGILNGADYGEWSPDNDERIPARYSAEDLSGKASCKRELLTEFGLAEAGRTRPLIGIVSRLARQKGMGLLEEVAGEILAEDTYLVVLGTGEPEYESFFRRLAAEYPERVGVRIGFDAGLAHRIEAGSDLFLMPSEYEPCGLNQMYSLRYGTVPVVRATGGLDDTIDEGTGFKFADYTGQALLGAVRAALRAYSEESTWRAMMLRGMRKDYSWKSSAKRYASLYQQLTGRA